MRAQTVKYNQLATDVARYKELQMKLNPDNDAFVIMDNTDDWKEFNRLTIKLTPLIVAGALQLTETKLF